MILKISQTGDDTLRLKAKELTTSQIKTPETQQLIDLMIATLRDAPGVGLAAPQVGESLSIIIIEDKKGYQEKVNNDLLTAQQRVPVPLKAIINPKLVIEEDKSHNLYFEGCLSVKGYVAVVPRSNKVTVAGVDREGKDISFTAKGWLARILQHEVGHLEGELYTDKMLPHSFIADSHYTNKWMKEDPDKLNKYLDYIQKH